MRKHLIVVALAAMTILVSVVGAQEEVILYEGTGRTDKDELCVWVFRGLEEGETLSWIMRCELQSEECEEPYLFIMALEEYEQKIITTTSGEHVLIVDDSLAFPKRYYSGYCTLFEEEQTWVVPFDGDWVLAVWNTQVLSVRLVYRISKLPLALETTEETTSEEAVTVSEFPFV